MQLTELQLKMQSDTERNCVEKIEGVKVPDKADEAFNTQNRSRQDVGRMYWMFLRMAG